MTTPTEGSKRYSLFSYSPDDPAQAKAAEFDTLHELRDWVKRFRQNNPSQRFRYFDHITNDTVEVQL